MRILEGCLVRVLEGCSGRLARGCLVALVSVTLHVGLSAARRGARRAFRPDKLKPDKLKPDKLRRVFAP